MKDKNDLLIASFFEQYGQKDIADNGFSQRVMSRLPRREWSLAKRMNTIWTCICGVAAIVLFILVDGIELILSVATSTFNHIFSSVTSINLTLASVITIIITVWILSAVAIYNLFSTDEADYLAQLK